MSLTAKVAIPAKCCRDIELIDWFLDPDWLKSVKRAVGALCWGQKLTAPGISQAVSLLSTNQA